MGRRVRGRHDEGGGRSSMEEKKLCVFLNGKKLYIKKGDALYA